MTFGNPLPLDTLLEEPSDVVWEECQFNQGSSAVCSLGIFETLWPSQSGSCDLRSSCIDARDSLQGSDEAEAEESRGDDVR